MVSLAMGAAMMATMYFLWARCAQHGGGASGGGLVCVSLRSYRALGYALLGNASATALLHDLNRTILLD